jgi:hypothetical protein
MGVQFGAGLIRSPPLSLEARLPIESHLAMEHVIDRTGQLLGQDGESFPLVVFVLQTGEGFLRRWMGSQEQDGGFSKGPLEMGLADLGA